MKAIILAAGMGTRLGDYTKERPKGMVEFLGKSLIAHQLQVLRSVGIQDIVVVRGYLPHRIDFPDVRFYQNDRYASTNMVETLLCAESELQGDVVVLYSDILYEPRILQEVMESKAEVGVVVDTDFREYWEARTGSLSEDNESLCLDKDGFLIEIGVPDPTPEKMDARYVGIIKFSEKGVQQLKEIYHRERDRYFEVGCPWYQSPSFAKGYMTDMLQCLIDSGVAVNAIPVRRGWLEIDTVQDMTMYQSWLNQNTLSRFFDATVL